MNWSLRMTTVSNKLDELVLELHQRFPLDWRLNVDYFDTVAQGYNEDKFAVMELVNWALEHGYEVTLTNKP